MSKVTTTAVLDLLAGRVRDAARPVREGMVRRLATPTDVGDAAALLCSEQAGSIAGQSLAVDGGASPACPDLPLDLQRR